MPIADDEGDAEHQRDGALAELDALVARPGRSRCGSSQRVPTTSVSYRTTRPRMNGHFDQRRAVEAGVEALGRADDLAVGVAEGDGDRVATAHQDALDERLAAVGVAWACRQVYRLRRADRNGGPEARRRSRRMLTRSG